MPTEYEDQMYYTAKEAAQYLGVSRPTFHKYVEETPTLKSYTIGIRKRRYYRQSDLDRLKRAKPSTGK